MRVDRFLFLARFTKSRTLAQALIEQGRVRIDGKRAIRPSELVLPGSVLAFPQRGQVFIVRILALPARRGPPAEASACYEMIDANVSQQAAGD